MQQAEEIDLLPSSLPMVDS